MRIIPEASQNTSMYTARAFDLFNFSIDLWSEAMKPLFFHSHLDAEIGVKSFKNICYRFKNL